MHTTASDLETIRHIETDKQAGRQRDGQRDSQTDRQAGTSTDHVTLSSSVKLQAISRVVGEWVVGFVG